MARLRGQRRAETSARGPSAASPVDSDLLTRSPVRPPSLGLQAVRKPDRPTLRADELLRLAAGVPARYRALVLLAGTVGLRWGECVGIRVGDIDFLRRRIRVEQTVEEVSGHVRVAAATKSEAGKRSFALPAFLIDELAAHLAAHRQGFTSDDLVFLGRRTASSAAASKPGCSSRRSRRPACLRT